MPQNFLVEMTPPPRNDEIEVFAADEESMIKADAIIQPKVTLKQCFPSHNKLQVISKHLVKQLICLSSVVIIKRGNLVVTFTNCEQ